MNYFDTVKEKIADYIVRDEVEENEEVISAYTLFTILENQNRRLRHTKEIEKGLLDKLNTIHPQQFFKEKGKLFKKKIKRDYFLWITSYIDDERSSLYLHKDSIEAVDLKKDFDYADIYSRNEALTEEAYNECSLEIETIFSELEYFGKLFLEEKKTNGHKNSVLEGESISNEIHCEGFDIEIKFDRRNKEFKYDIKLNKVFDPKGNSSSHYYNQENNLNHIIEENKEAILRNTPVNIGDLSYMFCMLVLNYKSRENRIEKTEEKKKIMKEIKMNED